MRDVFTVSPPRALLAPFRWRMRPSAPRRPGRLSLALLVLAVCFYALLIAASLSIQTESAVTPLAYAVLRASPRHARQEVPSKPAEQPSPPPPSDPPTLLPSSPPHALRPPPPPPSKPPARRLPGRLQPSTWSVPPSSSSSLPPPTPPTPAPPPTPPPPPSPTFADAPAPRPKAKGGRHAHGRGEQHGKADHGKGEEHGKGNGKGEEHGKAEHGKAEHGHGRPHRFVPQAREHGWEEDAPQRRLRVAVRPRVARVVSSRFVCATLDWWPRDKCDYKRCPWRGASMLEANLDATNPQPQPQPRPHPSPSPSPGQPRRPPAALSRAAARPLLPAARRLALGPDRLRAGRGRGGRGRAGRGAPRHCWY